MITLEYLFEHAAAGLGFDLGPPLIAISKTNLGEVNPDWLVRCLLVVFF